MDMNFEVKLTFLGFETKKSNKTGNPYFLVKFMDVKTSGIYEFYVKGDQSALMTKVGSMKVLSEQVVILKVSSFNGKPQVDLDGVA